MYYSINGIRLVLHEVEDGDLGLYKYTPRGINVNREIECFKNEIKIKLKWTPISVRSSTRAELALETVKKEQN